MTPEEQLYKAVRIAQLAHHGQTDKVGAPYIEHVERVAAAVTTPEEKAAAMLHDVLEDSGEWTAERLLQEGIAPQIVEAVLALTHQPEESYEAFIERAGRNPIARTVKIADLGDNMNLGRLGREPTERDLKRTAKYARALAILQAAP